MYDCIVLGLGAMGSACLYHLAKRGANVLGSLPGEQRVSFIAACNGGGFKFSSAYGEALADLASHGKTELPIGFMRPG
jgi:sarcosine oxidase